MVEPKTKLSDYIAYKTDLEALENVHLAGEIPPKDFLKESDAILGRHPKVYPADLHYFDDYKAFSMFIFGEMGVSQNSLELLKHEYRHFVEIRMRQLNCRFGCATLVNDSEGLGPDARTIDPFVVIEDVSRADAKDIVNATPDPSPRDQDLSDRL